MTRSNNSDGMFRVENKVQKKQNPVIIPIKTSYIRPGQSYNSIILEASIYLEDGDFLVISETPIAIAQGRLVDEADFKPSIKAFLLADVWSKFLWGYLLGPIFQIKKRTINNLRRLPKEARNHKQLIIEYYGWKHALKPASEAGVDLSNAPGSCVSLLPFNPENVVQDIRNKIKINYHKEVVVIIIDTDATYKLGKLRFTSIPQAVPGIIKDMGLFGYLLGRFGKIKGPTPLASSENLEVDDLIAVAKLAEDYHKDRVLNMETVYDMNETFNINSNEVTLEMLETLEHTPAVIIRGYKLQ